MSFRLARERLKLTQQEVAERLNIDQSTVSLWETGVTIPRGTRLIELAKFYGVTVDELLREDE